MILLIFFCFLLQSTLFQNIFAAAEIAPNFMVILTVSFGLLEEGKERECLWVFWEEDPFGYCSSEAPWALRPFSA